MFPPPVLEVELDDICRDERPLVAGRPWLMINMISTVDGVTDFDGVSGPLGSPGDKDVFSAIRALPDLSLIHI